MTGARQRLLEFLNIETDGRRRSQIEQKLGSTRKRLAEVLWRTSGVKSGDVFGDALTQALDNLVKAKRHYGEAFHEDESQIWILVQALSLRTVREGGGIEEFDLQKWRMAEAVSLHQAESDDTTTRRWAYGNLIELYLMVSFHPLLDDLDSLGCASILNVFSEEHAQVRARGFFEMAGQDAFEVIVTKMQVRRYLGLFPSLADLLPQGDPNAGRWEHVKASAETIVHLLSGESEVAPENRTIV